MVVAGAVVEVVDVVVVGAAVVATAVGDGAGAAVRAGVAELEHPASTPTTAVAATMFLGSINAPYTL
jgi:hypothetical protein